MKIRMKMEVASPLGEVAGESIPPSSRLDTLNGKIVCELSSNLYNEEIMFPILREMLRERYPNLKVIPFAEMNKELPGSTMVTFSGKIAEQEQKITAAIALAKKKGCNAVILGNGG